MTRVERERLIRAYVEGEMSLREEHDFLINVALDSELRLELKAQQTIDSAIRKDRLPDPARVMQLQNEVAAMLAAAGGGAPHTGRPADTPPSHTPVGNSRSAWRRTLLWLGGLMGTGAIVAGLAWLSPTDDIGEGQGGGNRIEYPVPALSPLLPDDPVAPSSTPDPGALPERPLETQGAHARRESSPAASASPNGSASRVDPDSAAASRPLATPRNAHVAADTSRSEQTAPDGSGDSSRIGVKVQIGP